MRGERRFFDVHSHILPGVDDGAGDIRESLLILKEASGAGVSEIVLTPHYPYNGNEMERASSAFSALKEAAQRESIGIVLHLGAELHFTLDLPAMIKGDRRLTVDGKGKYALIELPAFEIPMYAQSVFFSLLTMGVTPVWAHPERCVEVMNDCRTVEPYAHNGVLLQINAGSLLGNYGRKARSAAQELVKKGLANMMASDTHSAGSIKASLHDAFSCVEKLVGHEAAVDIAFSSPSRLAN